MSATTDKSCKCCGGPIKKRATESAKDYGNRHTCSRKCGQRLRRGIVTKSIDTTPTSAATTIEAALQAWHVNAGSHDYSQSGA